MRHKWENVFPLDKKSWGFRNEMQLSDVYTIEELIETVVSTVSCYGKFQRILIKSYELACRCALTIVAVNTDVMGNYDSILPTQSIYYQQLTSCDDGQ